MLRRFLILLLEIGVICILALAVGLFWASHYVDTPEFRQQFISFSEQVTGKPVELHGELNIALYPALSLEILDLSVADDSKFGDAPLARFNTLRISIRIIPLFSRQIDIRSIVVEGMEASIVRSSDGRINWQSILDRQSALMSGAASQDAQIKSVSLSELEVVNATIVYKDDVEGETFGLSGINLRTGAIDPGQSVPFIVQSSFAWRNGEVSSELILQGMLQVGGEDEHFLLKDATISASVGGHFLPAGANPGEMTAHVVMDWEQKSVELDGVRIRFLGLRAEGSVVSGDLSKEISGKGHIDLQQFNPAEIVSRYFPDAPVAAVDGLKTGVFSADFQFDESRFSIDKIVASLDDLTVRGAIAMQGYAHPQFTFSLDGGLVDLDRYMPLLKTDTPFVWDDFNLPLFRAFKGKGAIRAEGFKAMDASISDVRLAIDSDEHAIRIDAGATRNTEGPLVGNAEFRLGINGSTHAPTLGLDVAITAESQDAGFALLNMKPLGVTGAGRFKGEVHVGQMDCPPDGRSIDILRHARGSATLSLGQGKGSYAHDETTRYSLKYSKAECSLKLTPVAAGRDGYYGFNTDMTLHGQGNELFRTFSLSVQGPVMTAVDDTHVLSAGVAVEGKLAGALYTKEASRVEGNGRVIFDSAKHQLSIERASLHTLETTVMGEVHLTDLDTAFKGSGTLEVPDMNVKRIVYLLNKAVLKTKDTEALTDASLQTKFTVTKDGFRLSELDGKLDGMSFNGEVSGQGFRNPMLVASLEAGAFDLDRYLPPSTKPSLEELRAGVSHKAPPVDLPLAFLRLLSVSGKAWFEQFSFAKIRVNSLSGTVQADKGRINISDVKGQVHGGTLQAGWTGIVGEKDLSTHLKLHIEDMQTGPLMKDMATREYVRGVADVDIDLKSHGATDDDILKNLNGKAWSRINNGSFKFTGYEPTPTAHDRDPSGMTVVSDPRTRRTVFQKAMAYFDVVQGVFTVEKFRVEAPPILQSYGQGNFSLADGTIDLSIRNDFIAVPSVTLNVVGKLSDPQVKIPKGKIIDNTVRNILSLPEKSFNFLRDLFK